MWEVQLGDAITPEDIHKLVIGCPKLIDLVIITAPPIYLRASFNEEEIIHFRETGNGQDIIISYRVI